MLFPDPWINSFWFSNFSPGWWLMDWSESRECFVRNKKLSRHLGSVHSRSHAKLWVGRTLNHEGVGFNRLAWYRYPVYVSLTCSRCKSIGWGKFCAEWSQSWLYWFRSENGGSLFNVQLIKYKSQAAYKLDGGMICVYWAWAYVFPFLIWSWDHNSQRKIEQNVFA